MLAAAAIGGLLAGGATAAPHRSADTAWRLAPVTLSQTVDLPPWALDPPDWMRGPFVPRDPPVRRPTRPARPDGADAAPGAPRRPAPPPAAAATRRAPSVLPPAAPPSREPSGAALPVRTGGHGAAAAAARDGGAAWSDPPDPAPPVGAGWLDDGWRVADTQAPGAAEVPGDPAGARAAHGEAVVPEPAGYRMSDYRAPVPATLAGATVVDTAGAERLWRAGARFIDVLPRPPRPNLPAGTVWRAPPRDDIPGSLWLVNTGYGALAPDGEAYFRRGLEAASGGDLAAPLVFYCQRDCWMSFNAARRAIAAGYRAVHWYPLGTDGWAAAGLPLVRNEPEPGEPGYPPR